MMEEREDAKTHTADAAGGSPLAKAGDNGHVLLDDFGDEAGYGPVQGGIGQDTGRTFTPGVLLRYKWMIAAVGVVGASVSIALVWMLTSLSYVSVGHVEIQPIVQTILTGTEESGAIPFYTTYLNTQVSIIRSSMVIDRVLDDEDVIASSWYRNPGSSFFKSTPDPPNARLLKHLRVSPIRGTHVITVAFEAPNPADAKLIANRVVLAYREVATESKKKGSSGRYSVLLKQQAELREDVDRLGRQRREAAGGRSTASVEGAETYHSIQQATIDSQLRSVQRAMRTYQWELDQWDESNEDLVVTGAGAKDQADAPPDATAGGQVPLVGAEEEPTEVLADGPRDRQEDQLDNRHVDSSWLRLRDEQSRREEDLETAQDGLGDTHRLMKAYRTRLRYAQDRLVRREGELQRLQEQGTAGDGAPTIVSRREELVRNRDNTAYEVKLLHEELEFEKERAGDAANLQRMLQDIDADFGRKRQELNDVNIRITELKIESKVPGRVRIISEAALPLEPNRDRRMVFSVMALFGWFGVGLGLAYLRYSVDGSIREAGEVTATVRVPFLGQLPEGKRGVDILDDTDPAILENVRMIRTSLLDRTGDGGGCTVLVTSPGPQTGKTTFSLLMARSLGQLKKRVLLVDVDLRRMGLTRYLGSSGAEGMVDLLRGSASHADVVISPPQLGVDVVPAGQRVGADDPELFANGVFAECLRHWREKYDYILLDSPPVLPVADARMLVGQVDGTILTIRASYTPRSEAAESLSLITASGGKLFGTVLNRIKPRLGSYYKYSGYYDDGFAPKEVEAEVKA